MSYQPGPWTFEGPYDDRMHILACAGGMDITIAKGVTIENAPILAAAPDLVKALRWALQNIEVLAADDISYSEGILACRDALAKAGV
jgi:hypothetical protein